MPENLFLWSARMDGARDLLLKLKDADVLLVRDCGRDNKAYSDALYEALINKENMSKFLTNGGAICFHDHIRNKKGVLIKCEAYIPE